MNLYKKKRKVQSDEIAQVLVDEFIEHHAFDSRFGLATDGEVAIRYHAKMRLYRLALVLLILIAEEQNDSKFVKVRESLERLVFTMSQEQRMTFLLDVRNAMQQLMRLIFPKENPHELSWAMSWLEDIDVRETNPASLALFAMWWMDSYKMVVQTIREFSPI